MAPHSEDWNQMEDIFAAVADMPHADRGAYLGRACAGRDGLRAEIESLLAFDSDNTVYLSDAYGQAAADFASYPDQIGRRFGQYQATALIGSGGMGRVYLGVRADDQFYKNVAIKLIKRGLDTDAVVQRFRHERQILATLDHPYIGKLLDAGSSDDGQPYFVMEHIAGQSIEAYCESAQLTLEARCELFRKVCEAVSHAHRNLVIHRDLKPGNILVTEDGTPKLLDFGIASLLSPDTGTSATNTMARPMTPDYASPEQVRGGAVTTATDVYALGAVLYRLLTGVKPHRLEPGSPLQLERAICEETAARPSAAAPAKWRKQLAGDLDNIVMMALRKEPERRYQFVDQLSDDLRRHAAGLPVAASGDRLVYRMGRFVGRHRIGVSAAALLAVTLCGGIVSTSWEARQARTQQAEADRQRRRAEERLGQIAELANAALFDVNDALVRLPGATEARKKLVGNTLAILDKLAQTSDADPRILDVLSLAYMRLSDVQGAPGMPSLGDTEGAAQTLGKAVAVLARANPKGPRNAVVLMRRIDVEKRLGAVYDELGRGADSVAQHRAELAAAEALAALQPGNRTAEVEVADANVALAQILSVRDVREASKFGLRGVEQWERLSAKSPDDRETMAALATAYTAEGSILSRSEEPAKSLELHRKSLAIRERQAAQYPHDAVEARSLLISLLYVGDSLGDGPFGKQLGTPAESLPYYRKAVSIAEGSMKADPGNTAAQLEYAQALVHQGVVTPPPGTEAESMRVLREGATLTEQMLVKDPHSRSRRQNLGLAYEVIGQRLGPREALGYYTRMLSIGQGLYAEGDVSGRAQVVRGYKGIAEAQAKLRNREEALAAVGKMGEFAGRLLQADPQVAVLQAYVHLTEFTRGEVYRALGDSRRACAAYAASAAGWKGMPAVNTPRYRSEYQRAERALAGCK